MNKRLLDESFRRSLHRVVLFADAAAQAGESVAALQERFNVALQRRSAKVLASELGLSLEELEKELTPRLRAASRLQGGEPETASAQASNLAVLRALAWMEVVLTRKEKARPELLGEEEQPSEERARKQLRALELILRAFVNEAYPDQEVLLERLRLLFKTKAVDQWLAKAQPDDVLTGTVFQDLARVFTHEQEWPRYEPVYSRAQALNYLRDKRKAISAYLEDVRVIRNYVAHCKELSAVQIELLDTYYGILVDPIQQIFYEGRTGVDPRRFLEVDKAALEEYFTRLQGDVEELGQRTRAIEQNLEEVHTDVGTIGRRARSTHRRVTAMVVVLLAAVGAAIYAMHRVRSEVAHDYKSLGWVVLSAGVGA